MYLLYTDEVNLDPSTSEFFVYAGVTIPGEEAALLHSDIADLRERNGYQPGDPLKFNIADRPAHVNKQQHLDAKRELMAAAANRGVKLFASFLLHSIVESGDVDAARRKEINRICYHFNKYWAHRAKDHGLVLVDTFSDPKLNDHLREKFSIGIEGKLPFSKKLLLNRILGYHQATIGTSHFTSVVDVVIGAVRYAVNTRLKKPEVCKTLIGQLAPLCIPYSPGNGKTSAWSINFSPKNIKSSQYFKQYLELCKFFRDHGIDPAEGPNFCGS
jgi:hypothetical protein